MKRLEWNRGKNKMAIWNRSKNKMMAWSRSNGIERGDDVEEGNRRKLWGGRGVTEKEKKKEGGEAKK